MSLNQNYVIVDNPNQPDASLRVASPFAELIDVPANGKNNFDESIAKVTVQDMYLPHYSMRISKGEFGHDALFLNTSAQGLEYLGSCLFPYGNFQSHSVNGQKVVQSYSGTQNFKFDPQNEMRHRIAAHTPFHLIHFTVDPRYFLNFLPDEERWADELKLKIEKQERVFGNHSPAITLAQERALETILNCPLGGKLGEIMIETAITQIILIQMNIIFQQDPSIKSINKRDVEIAQGLKQHLTSNFLCDHTLEDLSKNFGTNTTKLMMLFKKNFGKSIFEFLSELRMDYAHKLLQDEHAVTEVSRIVGYKNAHHFSTAFKKRFGICPSQLIKLKIAG